MLRAESDNSYFPAESSPPRHKLETISGERMVDGRRIRLSVQLFDTLPLNGHHNGTIVSAPGLGAHPESQDTMQMRYQLNRQDFGAVDWYESPWGNRIKPLGQDSGLENERALQCQDLVLSEVGTRISARSVNPDIHLVGWSRGAAIAAAGVGRDPSGIKTLTLVCPGFMKDTSWAAARRYLSGRATDVIKGVRKKGVRHLREFTPFLKAAFANPHRMINRGGAAAGHAPLDEMFLAALAGIPQKIYQGSFDETFPPAIVRNTIEQGFIQRYDALIGNEGRTVFDKDLEELMPEFHELPYGHGIGEPEEAAALLVQGIMKMNQRLAETPHRS